MRAPIDRRDYLVPAQPKPASSGLSARTPHPPPRAKPEYIGNPSPSESDPAAPVHPACLCLPAYPLPLLYIALLCLLCLLLLSSACLALSFPGHFIRDGGGNQQLAIVPSELNTNIIFFFLRRCPTLATRSNPPFRFFDLRAPRASASLLHSRCSSPTGACPICATHRPPDPHPSCFRTCHPTLVHRRTTRHEARVCRMGPALTKPAPSQ